MIRQQTAQDHAALFPELVLSVDDRPHRHTTGEYSRGQLSNRTLQPGSPVELPIDWTGFTIDRDQIKQNGRRYMMASHPATGIHVSIALEKVSSPASTGDASNSCSNCRKDRRSAADRPSRHSRHLSQTPPFTYLGAVSASCAVCPLRDLS